MANKGPFKGKGKDKGTMNADDAKRAEEEYWVGIEVKREMYAFLVEAGFKGNEQWDFFLQIFFEFFKHFSFPDIQTFFSDVQTILDSKISKEFFSGKDKGKDIGKDKGKDGKGKDKGYSDAEWYSRL